MNIQSIISMNKYPYLFIQLNILNYYYNLQVYKHFYFIRTVLSHTNENRNFS